MLQNSLTLPKKTNGWTLKRWFHKGDVPFKKFGDFWRPAVGFRAWPHPIFAAIFSNSRASMLMIFPQKKHVSTRFLHIFIPNSRSFSHFIVHSEVDFFGRGRKPCFFDPPIYRKVSSCPSDGAPRWLERARALAPSFPFFRGFRRRP